MSIELICIGNELLSGKTLNTNATWIAEELLTHGYRLARVTVLPDQIDTLREGIREALSRSSYLITTGGLGPTGDDLTLEAVASALDLPFLLNKQVEKELTERFGADLPMLKRQAMAPKGATPLHNPIGTAPGYFIEKGGKALFIFPGVPSQMEELLKKDLLPYLEKNVKSRRFLKELFFCPMDETRVDPLLRQIEKENPGVELGICPSYEALSVYLSIEGNNQKEADQRLLPLAEKITAPFASYLFSTSSRKVEKALHDTLIQRKLTLALAESCTGGKMSSRLVAMSGASAYFLGSVIAYSNEVKEKILSVSSETLRSEGAVSKQTVLEMAKGMLKLTGADFAISVSGIAGPLGGTKEKPVGTVWGAIGVKGGELFAGQLRALKRARRDLIIDYAGSYLFFQLYRYLHHNIPPFTP